MFMLLMYWHEITSILTDTCNITELLVSKLELSKVFRLTRLKNKCICVDDTLEMNFFYKDKVYRSHHAYEKLAIPY